MTTLLLRHMSLIEFYGLADTAGAVKVASFSKPVEIE